MNNIGNTTSRLLIFLVLSLLATGGCATRKSEGNTALTPSVVEGTIVSAIAVEEGFLRVDLPNGTRMEFMTDESVASTTLLLGAAGKKCRVYYRNDWHEDIDGIRSPALLMTKIELL